MAGTVSVREFKSEAEMRAHYAALHRKCFTPVARQAETAVAVEEEPQRQPDVDVASFDHEAWAEYVARMKAMFGVADVRSVQQRSGIASASGHDVLRIVAEVTGFTQGDLKGRGRDGAVVRARQIACWLLVNRAAKSLPEAGRLLGNRDHTTILHGCRRADEALATLEPPLPDSVEGLARLLSVIAWPREKVRLSKAPKAKRHACVLCGTTLKAPQ